jgi:hypothetical protein
VNLPRRRLSVVLSRAGRELEKAAVVIVEEARG